MISLQRSLDCASPREAIWSALADTHRFSRALGGTTLAVQPLEDAGAARFLVSTRSAGLRVIFEERPFEWRAPERLVIRRALRGGPITSYRLAFALDERPQGCHVAIELDVEPRWALVWPLLRLRAQTTIGAMVRLLARIDAQLVRGEPAYPERAARIASRPLAAATQRLHRAVGPAGEALARRLVDDVMGAPDFEAEHLRPYVLAARWGADRREVLTLCLEAVCAGLLELRWEVVCPSCRVAASHAETLAELGAELHCHQCDLTVAMDFDRCVEAVVRPADAIRALPSGPYCIGGPFRTPHVVEQAILPARGEATLHAPREGRCRIYVRGGGTASLEVVSTGAHEVELRAGTQLDPGQLHVAPGATLRVVELLGEERHVKVEHLEWASFAATGVHVSTLPAFRRLFSGQVLRPGLRLGVARMAFVFTDLSDSTAFYDRVGDAEAFAFIRDHFDATAAVVDRHRGAVIKTIGDAMMTAFADDEDAVRAAVAMQRAHQAVMTVRGGDVPALKVGVHAGACFAVTTDGVLDYFGQTVNVAHRLESAARPGDVILPIELARAAWLDGAVIADELEVGLKGVTGQMRIARVAV